MKVSGIVEKYTFQLSKSKRLGTVWYSDAETAIRQAVDETAQIVKKEIENAIEPLRNKIAKQDEFILAQQKTNNALEEHNKVLNSANFKLQEDNSGLQQKLKEQKQHYESENGQLQNENESLKSQIEFKNSSIENLNKANEGLKNEANLLGETASKVQQKLEQYKKLAKEAYRQGITPEIREQKAGIADVLASLVQHKQKPVAVTRPQEYVTENNSLSNTKRKSAKKTTLDISEKLINRIKLERQKQVLDKERMDKSSVLIKSLLEDAPDKGFRDIQEYFQKIKNRYLDSIIYTHYKIEKDKYASFVKVYTDSNGKIVRKDRGINFKDEYHPYQYNLTFADNSSVEIYDANSDSYIKFIDTNGKELLYVGFSDYYWFVISDKNGCSMVRSSIKDGVMKYLNVIFNDVKPTSKIISDIRMNNFAKNLIENAKQGTVSRKKYDFLPTDIVYENKDGALVVNEDYIDAGNKRPIFTYLFNPNDGKLKYLINIGDFGLHAKHDEKSGKWIQYNTQGITKINKYGKDDFRDFGISFCRTTENEHWEVLSLHDRNYSTDYLRPVYEKFNYGTASHPLTQRFTYHDLSSKREIKPWDFSILKPYIK